MDIDDDDSKEPFQLKCSFQHVQRGKSTHYHNGRRQSTSSDVQSSQYNYTIRLSCKAASIGPYPNFQEHWTITKRYKDFYRLNSSFFSASNRQHFAGAKMPEFPGKVVCFREDTKLELANKRLVSLEIYLKELISRPLFMSFVDVRAFLEMPPSVRELCHNYYDKESARSMKVKVEAASAVKRITVNEERIDELCGTIESLVQTVHALKEEIKGLKRQMNERENLNQGIESTSKEGSGWIPSK